ncbi:MAG: ParB/RepB/Spo0J family partition protein [Phycisphaerales bacterium]
MASASKSNRSAKPRLGRGLSSLMSAPVEVSPTPTPAAPAPAPDRAVVEAKPTPPRSAPPPPGNTQTKTDSDQAGLRHVRLDAVVPSRHQPRKSFDDKALQELAASIRASGLMQPVALRPLDGMADAPAGAQWELVAGERRWRAARMAGLETIPALVVALSDDESAAWAVVENLQREDLNPIETAEALRALQRDHGLTQTEIAERVGLDRSSVANLIRLTELPPAAQALVAAGALTTGHAKALLSAPEHLRAQMARRASEQGWSVRKLEQAARESQQGGDVTPKQGVTSGGRAKPSASQADLEKRLGEHLGTRVHLQTRAGGKKGRLVIEFYDLDHFDGLLTKFGFRS